MLSIQIRSLHALAQPKRIAVIGGGASGMFSAAAMASYIQQHKLHAEVHVLEATSSLMSKVKISGGGRCNVLHDTQKPVSEILNGYPRGKKELNGLFQKHFSPSDARRWFEERGVELKTELDGRMFPITDSSLTIMDTIRNAAEQNQVQIKTKQKVLSIERSDKDMDDRHEEGYYISMQNEQKEEEVKHYSAVIMATGSNPRGYKIAQELGLKVNPPVPSLFTFNTKNQNKEGQVFHNLSGLSVQDATITLKIKVEGKKKKKVIAQDGPILITHHGLSGPAVLRLSAFAAKEFKDMNYRGDVFINWAPSFGNAVEIEKILWPMTSIAPKKKVSSVCPLLDENGSSVIPKRLWAALVKESDIEPDQIWAEASKKKIGKLSRNIAEFVVDVTGKGVFKDEFVTAGGVSLKQLNMKTLESKKLPGLYFCGELIDVDGITGGYNFMNCWSTGYMSGTSCAMSLEESNVE